MPPRLDGAQVPEFSRADVLIVDDNDDIRESILIYLSDFGYQAKATGSALEALQMLRDGLRPKLTLLDLNMPTFSGWGFCMALAQDPELENLPVAIITGSPAYRGTPYRKVDAGVFRKPIEFDELLGLVKSIAGQTKAGEPG